MSAALDRTIVLWPWQLPEGPELLPVAVANPAIESVWVRDAAPGETRPCSPHGTYDADAVVGVDLILRVICTLRDSLQQPGKVGAPRATVGSGAVAIDYFRREDVDQS
ncbi:MAG: hypothetical protein H7242_15450, partial [Microbacteriaceae bacterium]|nr:hypothetical protein [Burkholderiaceae bacterium]